MKDILLELLVIIAPHKSGDKIIAQLYGLVSFVSVIHGRGTAPSEFLSALGIGEPEKDMIFCFCENKNIDLIYEKLGRLSDGKANGPIAMTIPVSAVGGNLTLQILLGKTKELI